MERWNYGLTVKNKNILKNRNIFIQAIAVKQKQKMLAQQFTHFSLFKTTHDKEHLATFGYKQAESLTVQVVDLFSVSLFMFCQLIRFLSPLVLIGPVLCVNPSAPQVSLVVSSVCLCSAAWFPAVFSGSWLLELSCVTWTESCDYCSQREVNLCFFITLNLVYLAGVRTLC